MDVELLHSLGCYRNASIKAEEFTADPLDDAGKAFPKTRELNQILDEHRDWPKGGYRHPDPIGNRIPAAPSKHDADGHEHGLLLGDCDASRERFGRIVDFYSVGIAGLNCLREPDLSKDWSAKPNLVVLEKVGASLFWDRDSASAVKGVNQSFEKRRKAIRKARAGSRSEDLELEPSVRRRIDAKLERFLQRRTAAEEALKPRLSNRLEWEASDAGPSAARLWETNLTTAPKEALITPGFVVQCLVAAHLRLHHVEHLLSAHFRQAMRMSADEREEPLRELREAETLNTFVYVVSRSVPWLFAEHDKEMTAVREKCENGFEAGSKRPPKIPPEARDDVFGALWRAQRISFLALHRRAFGHSLRDTLVDEAFNDTAFKDFHKLQRLLRVQRRVLLNRDELNGKSKRRRGKFLPSDYVVGIDALAETHIGDLYRADHAHPIALQHFCDAQDRLDQLSAELLGRPSGEPHKGGRTEGPSEVADLLQDSRWRIHLMMSKGKGFYEAGNLKRSVKWLLKSWSALLVLEEHGRLTGNSPAAPIGRGKFKKLENAIETLREIKNDPDFSKGELRSKVEPVVRQALDESISDEFKVIASEILLRLGHVLYVIRFEAGGSEPLLHDLAKKCLEKAQELDATSVLVLADQLKIQYQRGEFSEELAHGGREQWPFGRGNPEQLIRMIEYRLLRWLVEKEATESDEETDPASSRGAEPDDAKPHEPRCSETSQAVAAREQNRKVARKLIAGLLTHTDSINVRQSQVYRYLMQPKRPARRIGPVEAWREPVPRDPIRGDDEVAIELVCLRRYSSFFPFVPRPSAFRSLGGGYLLRLHHRDDGCPQPFGVAVDPGPDFIENLYRCGFGLGDINMIILTHDHPDHSVDLAPILSLLGYRMKHGDDTFHAPSPKDEEDTAVRRLLIVGNESVTRQLQFFNKAHLSEPGAGDRRRMRPDAVQVVSFDQFEAFRLETNRLRETDRKPEVLIPDELRLKPVVSVRHPDGYGMLAYGFRLSLGEEGPSVGFTGDTGGFLLEMGRTAIGDETHWSIQPHDAHGTMKLAGDRTWSKHWEPVLDVDVLIPHVSGLPLSQLLVLANDGLPEFVKKEGVEGGLQTEEEQDLSEVLSDAWKGLEESVRKQVAFAFWLPKDESGVVSLPLEPIRDGSSWPKGHLYLIGLLEFARAYQAERQRADKPGLFLIGELREELGSLRGKIAYSLNEAIFGSIPANESDECGPDCRSLTSDIGLRLMISREKNETRVRVLCSTCDLDNDRTRHERFHDPRDVREVCVKGEHEGMFYNCPNHDPSGHTHPVFVERVERYDVFSPTPIH